MNLLAIALILLLVTRWTWQNLATTKAYRIYGWKQGWQYLDTVRATSYHGARKQAERQWLGQLKVEEIE